MYMHLDKRLAGDSETREYGEGNVPPFRSPFNLLYLESTYFNVLCNRSLVVGAGGTEDA